MAILLWLFVVSGTQYSMVINVPIEARNLNARKALKEEVPEYAQVRFKGTGRSLFKAFLLKKFYTDGYKVVLDLERISEEYDFYLNEYFEKFPNKVVIPSGWEIEYVEVVFPKDIHISLDEYLVKEVPVIPNLTVKAAPGYVIVSDILIEPKRIEIAGPKELTSSIMQIQTDYDTIEEAMGFQTGTINLEILGPLFEYSHKSIYYQADIQAISERIIIEIPVTVENVLPGLRVFVNPHTVSLTAIGGVNLIASLKPEDIIVRIDFESQWNPKQQFYKPEVIMPSGVMDWQDLSPRNLELVVTKEIN